MGSPRCWVGKRLVIVASTAGGVRGRIRGFMVRCVLRMVPFAIDGRCSVYSASCAGNFGYGFVEGCVPAQGWTCRRVRGCFLGLGILDGLSCLSLPIVPF